MHLTIQILDLEEQKVFIKVVDLKELESEKNLGWESELVLMDMSLKFWV